MGKTNNALKRVAPGNTSAKSGAITTSVSAGALRRQRDDRAAEITASWQTSSIADSHLVCELLEYSIASSVSWRNCEASHSTALGP
jgi:hypothetical protein